MLSGEGISHLCRVFVPKSLAQRSRSGLEQSERTNHEASLSENSSTTRDSELPVEVDDFSFSMSTLVCIKWKSQVSKFALALPFLSLLNKVVLFQKKKTILLRLSLYRYTNMQGFDHHQSLMSTDASIEGKKLFFL